jgi:mono/diheme cytochrome c family protein
MPASESTWRNQRLLHRIFAVTGVSLLVATVWMLYADHDREWKHYHDKSREIDLAYNDWYELQYQTNEAIREHEELETRYREVLASPVDAQLLAAFKAEAESTEISAERFKAEGIETLVENLTAAIAAESKSAAGSEKPGDNTEAATTGDSTAAREAVAASPAVVAARQKLMAAVDSVVANAKFHETNALSARKFKNADLDAVKAQLDIAIRDNKSAADRGKISEQIKAVNDQVEELKRAYQSLADHRGKLQSLAKQIKSRESEAKRARDDNFADLKKLESTYVDRRMTYFVDRFPFLGKKWLSLPILDAFNSPRKIDNLWSDDLTIDYNFRRVRRFDRCTTCHQAMEKSKPGQPDQPQYDQLQELTLVLNTPSRDELEKLREEVQGRPNAPSSLEALNDQLLSEAYGLRVAQAGLVSDDDVTLTYVKTGSRAATAKLAGTAANQPVDGEQIRRSIIETPVSYSASPTGKPTAVEGLLLGDVVTHVNGNAIDAPRELTRQLLMTADFGKPVTLKIRRGFSSPFASHPRLDLYVSSGSPHRMQTFACTACHEGQGSATDFKWASHAPNDTLQEKAWAKQYGYFDNEHWIYPMYPSRFAESACLKCHHEVVELEPSEKFPDPPAPKVTHGYHLIRKYGCYGCHEVKGYEGPNKRLGPDMRLEANYFAASLQLKAVLENTKSVGKLTAEERRWIETLAESPERSDIRGRILEMLQVDEKSAEPRLPGGAHKLASLFKDEETPGDLRKAGPSLRYMTSKLDDQFAYDWMREPKHFRPSTRMPQFFGLWDHLEGHSKELAAKFEPAELLGMLTYLKVRSQSFEYLVPPEVKEPAAESDEARQQARVERGKVAFEERGCLACHTHGDFPDVARYRRPHEIVQGPDLTGLGSKFAPSRNPNGTKWLYSWIKEPTKYHARTVMPNLYLDPVEIKDEKGKVTATVDPVADIVAYLMTSTNENWKAPDPSVLGDAQESVDDMVLEYLSEAFFEQDAKDFQKKGIPNKRAASLKGPEREMLVSDEDFASGKGPTLEQKLSYIGRKTIGKYGCFGCHDMPGFEDAKPIGTGLADWGRKDPSKLAFEHITHYLHAHGEHGAHGGDHSADANTKDASEHGDHAKDAGHGEATGGQQGEMVKTPRPQISDFYKEQLEGHHRTGFIWQKLAEPRSYDYMKTENKKYNDRLRMPKFPFSEEEREAVITFVLGLVADPPAPKYLYKPDAKQQALIAGKQVLDKYNCAGCHVLEAEKWDIAYKPGDFGPQSETKMYPYLRSHISPEDVKASLKQNAAGQLHATIVGMPSLSDADARPNATDKEDDPVEIGSPYDPASVKYPFELWKPAVLDGQIYEPGVMQVNVATEKIVRRRAANGGVLARYLLPSVTQREKKVNPAAKGSESWAWVPPPLVGEGSKVQSNWLHDFLLNPYPIRPAVVLRMPKFNLSSEESSQLVEYFAAVDGAQYPYESTERRQPSYLDEKLTGYRESVPEAKKENADRFQDALRIVTNGNYCVKCHIVGDYQPEGADRAKAPNLARIYERLRPDYLRNWIANPKSILPYTSMPINIPYDPADEKNLGGVAQDLYHGTSVEQVESLVDLLMNYDNFAKRSTRIAPLVQQAPPPAADAEAKPESAAGSE